MSSAPWLGRGRHSRVLRSGIAFIGTATLLAACSLGGGGGTGTAQESKTLTLGSFAGNTQEGFMKCAINGFQQESGIEVLYQAGNGQANLAIVKSQKNNPTIDMIVGNDANTVQGSRDGLLQEYDKSKIPNLANVDQKFIPSNAFAVPLGLGLGGISYNTDIFKARGWAPPTTWNDLFDPKFKGHVGIIDLTSSYSQLWFSQVAQMNGGSPQNFEPAFEAMKRLKPNLLAVYQTDAQMDQAFAQGNVWIAQRGGNRTLLQKNAKLPVEFVQPAEGTTLLPIHMLLVKNAKHADAAYKLMDYMLSPKVQQCIAPDIGFGPVRKDTKAPDDVRLYLSPNDGVKITQIDHGALIDQLSALTTKFNQTMGG